MKPNNYHKAQIIKLTWQLVIAVTTIGTYNLKPVSCVQNSDSRRCMCGQDQFSQATLNRTIRAYLHSYSRCFGPFFIFHDQLRTHQSPSVGHCWAYSATRAQRRVLVCYFYQFRKRVTISINADAGLIMFDVTSQDTYESLGKWQDSLIKMCGNIPIVLIGNKADLLDRGIEGRPLVFQRRGAVPYFEVSAKYGQDVEKPVEWVIGKLIGKSELCLVENVSGIMLPDIPLNPELLKRFEEEFSEAANAPLPEEDDFQHLLFYYFNSKANTIIGFCTKL
eukprot:TRINITY_DN2220_c0_g1_i2.p1 TRINITY_DN2220_c0_g1~~TRINITY_DN2220_c0_g1_i2.p1  ORF type:complete len:297 (+),score=-5.41 TRINITY_DN2220_c0_g1_i2:59-892(+)